MNSTVKKLIVRNSMVVKLSPLILWFMAFVLPTFVGQILVEQALEIDKRLWRSSGMQSLMNESLKYTSDLNPENFLHKATNIGPAKFQTNLVYKKKHSAAMIKKLEEDLQNIALLRQLPWGSFSVKRDAKKFATYMKNLTGIKPAAMYCLGPDKDTTFVISEPPFELPVKAEKFWVSLEKAYRFWKKSFDLAEKRERYYRNFNAAGELIDWLGYLFAPDTELTSVSKRFSSKSQDEVFHFTFTFKDGYDRPLNLNLVYPRKKLDWQFILAKVLKQKQSEIVEHDFGYSNLKKLPHFQESDEELVFIFELPEVLRVIYEADKGISFAKTPVIRLRMSRKVNSNFLFNSRNLAFFCKLLLLLSFMLILALYLRRNQLMSSLRLAVTLAFLSGSLVPIIGLSWFALSYFSCQKHFEAESIMNEMSAKLEQADKRLHLQKLRDNVYLNIMADRIGRISLPDRKRLPEIMMRVLPDPETGELTIHRPYKGFFLTNKDSSEIFEIKQTYSAAMQRLRPFLSGFFNEIMLGIGGYDHLGGVKVNQLRQQIEFTVGLTEQEIDQDALRRMVEYEGMAMESMLSTKKENTNTFILGNRPENVNGLLTFFTDNDFWLNRVVKLINAKKFKVNFTRQGYKITLAFFPVHYSNLRELNLLEVENAIIPKQQKDELLKLGRAIYAYSENIRLNNLSHKKPHLIVSKLLSDKEVFAVAYAEKKSELSASKVQYFVGFAVFIALVACVALAMGTAKILLMYLPVFSEAISRVQKRDFLWQISLKSGDEFEQLADSFNLMGRKLLEREKMAQLVSGNVISAIAKMDEGFLEPGGEKVKATILFSDIRSFTTLSETYPAEEIVIMLNDYFTIMADCIESQGGFIDKLIGDAMQAVFYDLDEQQTAAQLSACRAALVMQQALKEFNLFRSRQSRFNIQNGIGISSGEVIAGRVGTDTGKLDATVMGKVLNKAEFLESASKNARHSNILIDQNTCDFLNENNVKFDCRLYKATKDGSEKAYELISIAMS